MGAHTDTTRAKKNLGADWLVGSAVTFLQAASHMTDHVIWLENKTADDAQPRKRSPVPRPFLLFGAGSGDETSACIA